VRCLLGGATDATEKTSVSSSEKIWISGDVSDNLLERPGTVFFDVTVRLCLPYPAGNVIEIASRTPATERATTEWPMLMPGPKFVYVIPRGAINSIRALIRESMPGSQPEAITATALPAIAEECRASLCWADGISVYVKGVDHAYP
jgi:hypothetical protein